MFALPHWSSSHLRRVQQGQSNRLSGGNGDPRETAWETSERRTFQALHHKDCVNPFIAWLEQKVASTDSIEIHCLRDLTRGGLFSALNEIASAAGVKLSIDERAIPIRDEVQGACELLGLDPLYVANEGRFVAFVPEAQADHAFAVMRSQAVATEAVRVGEVDGRESSIVVLKKGLGTHRILDLLSGEQLPRIC